jgi:hypothetical protein
MNSRVWTEFEKIISKGDINKIASNKTNISYNVIPPKAGNDTPVETSGFDLIEIAHPEQMQVANSQLNDGIVENSLEQHKIMLDIARRNSRGVFAELLGILVKAANVLDSNMTNDSLQMAKTVDELIEKIAQDNFFSPDSQFSALLNTAQKVVKEFGSLDWSRIKVIFSIGEHTEEKELVEKVRAQLNNYVSQAREIVDQAQKTKWSQVVAAIVKSYGDSVTKALVSARTGTFFITEAKAAREAWMDLLAIANSIQTPENKPTQTQVPGAVMEGQKQYTAPPSTTIPKIKPETSHTQTTTHHYSVKSPEVGELQELLGVNKDDKFGKDTWGALMVEAENDPNLKEYLQTSPVYAQGYQHWDQKAVEHVVNTIKQFRQTQEVDSNYMNSQSVNKPEETQTQEPFEMMEEQPAVTRLKGLYPNVAVYENRVYPYGIGDGSSSYPGYPLNERWLKYLESGGTK